MSCKYCNKDCNPLFGWGNPQSPVIIVGENPGNEEVKKREPFVGRAGKKLEQALSDLNVPKSSLYITNTCCFLTPKADGTTGNPDKDMVESCRPHIIAEIQQVKPRAIISLGGIATHALTGIVSLIGMMRGQSLDLLPLYGHACKVFPSWHPSFIARGQSKHYPQLLSDIKNALTYAGILDKTRIEKKFEILLDFDEIFSYLKACRESKALLSFDLETSGGKMVSTTIIGISFCYEDAHAVYIPIRTLTVLGQLEKVENYDRIVALIKELLESAANPKTAFNSKYEIEVCKSELGINVVGMIFDAMLAHYLLYEEDKYPSLEELEALNFPNVKTMKSKIKNMKLKDYSFIPLEDLGIYSAEDAFYTRKLAFIYRKKLQEITGWGI